MLFTLAEAHPTLVAEERPDPAARELVQQLSVAATLPQELAAQDVQHLEMPGVSELNSMRLMALAAGVAPAIQGTQATAELAETTAVAVAATWVATLVMAVLAEMV